MPAAPSAPAPSLLSHDTGATGPSVGRVVRGAEYRGIVLDRGAFVLTDADVARIERVLSAGITSDARITRAPSEYTRQYVAYRDGGARRVSIALHCEAPPDWQTQGLPEVLGGGNCYLRATYDLDSDRVLSISVSSGR